MTDRQRLERALIAAHEAGDREAAQVLAQAIRALEPSADTGGAAFRVPGMPEGEAQRLRQRAAAEIDYNRQPGAGQTAFDRAPPDNGLMTQIGRGVSGFASGALNSMTAGFADEAAGALGSVPYGYTGYSVPMRDVADASLRGARQAAPIAGVAGEIAGFFTPGSATGAAYRAGSGLVRAAPEGASMLQRGLARVGQEAAGGAAAGAALGFGSGDGLQDRVQQAAQQGAIGGVIGGLSVPAMATVQSAGTALVNTGRAITNPLDRSRVLDVMRNTFEADDLLGAQAVQRTDELAGLAPRPPMTEGGRISRAQDEIRRASRADQPVPAVIDVAQAEGGENTLRMFENAGLQPGRARTAIRSEVDRRASQMVPVLDEAITQATGGTSRSTETLRGLRERQSRQAEALYGPIRNIPIPESDLLARLTRMPAVQDGIRAALQASENTLDDASRQAFAFIRQAEDGSFFVAPNAPVQTWDVIKRGMDDALYRTQRDPQGLPRMALNEARNVRRAVVRELDRLTSPNGRPEDSPYAAAREAFAGEQAVQEAFDVGQQVLRTDGGHSEFMDALADMTASEREGLVAGVREAMQTLIGESRATPGVLNRVLDRRDVQVRITAALGREAGGRLLAQMRTMADRARAGAAIDPRTGSQTASRLIEDQAQSGMMAVSSPNVMEAAGSFLRDLVQRGGRLSPRENELLTQYGIDPTMVYRAFGQTRAYAAYRQAGYPQREAAQLALRWTGSGVPDVPPYQRSPISVTADEVARGAAFATTSGIGEALRDE